MGENDSCIKSRKIQSASQNAGVTYTAAILAKCNCGKRVKLVVLLRDRGKWVTTLWESFLRIKNLWIWLQKSRPRKCSFMVIVHGKAMPCLCNILNYVILCHNKPTTVCAILYEPSQLTATNWPRTNWPWTNDFVTVISSRWFRHKVRVWARWLWE